MWAWWSDRILSLMIELLPDAMKQQLRFASFAPSPVNGYHLAAPATPDCDQSGWQRLVMTLAPGQLPPKLQEYVQKVRECLAYGDISSLRNQQSRLTLERGTAGPALTAPKPAPQVGVAPVPMRSQRKRTDVPHMGRPSASATSRRDHTAEHSGPRTAHWRGGRRQVPVPLVGLLLLILTVGCGWSYLKFFYQGGGLSWSELLTSSFTEQENDSGAVSSLLEVVRVSEVYDRQIRGVKRMAMIPGLNNLGGDGQEHLEALRRDAAGPLLAQIDMFRDLAAAGIQQGTRPDRERERLRALAHQGDILDVECQRLILAWHSLAQGVYWQDLAGLSDAQVRARRDSLQAAAPQDHAAALRELDLENRPQDLAHYRQQTWSMARLLALFDQETFSEEWAADLYGVAESVSPTASPATRAYRNSAFALARLKRMEHGASLGSHAYADSWQTGQWLPAAVLSALPDLRQTAGTLAAGTLAAGEAPPLVADTVALYRWLESSDEAVAHLVDGSLKMAELENNQAVAFDRTTYTPLLRRLNHEAVVRRLQAGQATTDLATAQEAASVADFEEALAQAQMPGSDSWSELAETLDDPFLAGWAAHMARRNQERQLQKLNQFETQWVRAQAGVAKIRTLAGGGSDWSAAWRDLDRALRLGLEAGRSSPSVSATNQQRCRIMRNWRNSLRAPAPLQLEKLTVRLAQDRLAAAGRAVLELRVLPNGPVVRGRPFSIGPAAPAGSGWVGTVGTGLLLADVTATDAFELKVMGADDGRELLKVDIPSLADGAGPGALSRAQGGDGGTVRGRVGPGWWRALQSALQPELSMNDPG